MLTTSMGSVTYPLIVIKVEGVICRALIDSGSGSSYVSAVLASKINKKTKQKEPKKTEMMFHTTTKWVEIFDVTIQNIEGNFELKTQLNKVEKDTLLSLPNPNYLEIISHYPHLNDIKLNDIVKKKELPVHVILGVSDYAKIKMQERPRIGQPGDPIAELTRFGWFIMSPGHESNLTHLLFSNTSAQDYEKLCSLDVLGIEENHNFKDTEILDKFKKQLKQSDEGWYETGLIWKTDHPVLTNNKSNSLGRLNNLLKHLKKNSERFIAYDKVIQEQLEDGIVETGGCRKY